jgi:tRNA dimethylallyltransferase
MAMSMSTPGRLPKVVVIAGPTAVGKTSLSIELARKFDGEVVNADSRYLYRGFNTGVAKPSLAERKGVPHHLIDILEPEEEMSLALFQERANSAISSVLGRERLPFLTGGTPLYINAVIEGWRIPEVPPDPEFRLRLEQRAEFEGIDPLLANLAEIDPESAARTGKNLRRIIRALEIHEATGRTMSELQNKGPMPYDTLELGLTMPRPALFAAIDKRVDDQIANGLVEEARGLLKSGADPGSPAFSSLGYRQLLPYFEGIAPLEAAVERIKFDTHRYVRHQETWLKRNPRLIRIDVTEQGWEDRCAGLVREFVQKQ